MIKKVMLGGNLFFYAINKKKLNDLLDFSIDHGINSIDTADIYSNGKSEKMIGSLLKKKRNKWFISTKLGQNSSDKREHQNSKKNIISKVDKSLKRLKTDYIDLYQLHHYDPITPSFEIIETLNILKKEGKILNYGLSNYGPIELKKILGKKNSNIYSNQIHSNILKNNIDKYKFFFDKLKFISFGTLGRGLISDKFLNKNYKSFRFKKSNSIKNDLTKNLILKLHIIDDFCKNYNGWDIQKFALHYMLNNKRVFKVILGVRNINQLKEFLIKIKKIPNKDLINLEKKLKKSGQLKSKLGEV
tara:strand:+ start:202 stop:1107 length:906 start_codon:yes stop_codon:yes gene_type:complete